MVPPPLGVAVLQRPRGRIPARLREQTWLERLRPSAASAGATHCHLRSAEALAVILHRPNHPFPLRYAEATRSSSSSNVRRTPLSEVQRGAVALLHCWVPLPPPLLMVSRRGQWRWPTASKATSAPFCEKRRCCWRGPAVGVEEGFIPPPPKHCRPQRRGGATEV